MKKCFVFISGIELFAAQMVKTQEGWETFLAPVVSIGEELSLTDQKLGAAVEAVILKYRTGIPDEEVTTDSLDRSVREYGFRSWRVFFRDCLQMSVDETPEGYELIPYERLNRRGEEGSIPRDIVLSSTRVAADLGRAVRECISYCR
jgi:hypothetical protein